MIRPETNLPTLTGCGTRVHTDRPIRPTMPGYETPLPAPGASRTWLLDDDVAVHETRGGYVVTAPDLPTPVLLTVAEVCDAAGQLRNLIAARLHQARRAVRDDDVDQTLAAMLAAALRGAA